MAAKIQVRRDTSANWASVNPVLSQGEIGLDLTTGKIKIGDGSTTWSSLSYFVGNPAGINLNDLGDVVTSSVAAGDFLRWDGSNWINDAVNLSTDTVGDYVASLTAGTGVTVTNNSGEGATPTVAIGQAVGTSSSVNFAAVTASTFTGNLVGNADTASQLATSRTISLSGDLSGSVSFSGSTDVTLNATVVNSGVLLDELSDVIITSPEEFQGLSYNGTNWVNSHIPLVSYVQNAEATTITTGTCVYLFGGTGDHASVKRADNSTDTTSSKTVGVAGANISASQNGPVVTRGYVDGIDLSVGYSPGDVLWLGENGAFTTTKPSAPDHLVFIGVVVRATNNGIIYVATQNGYELEELHDVKISSPQNNDFLKYNSASAIWVNDPINLGTDTVGNYMTDVVAGTNISITHTPGEGSSASIAVVGSPTFDSLLARQSVGVGFDPLGSGQVVWYGSTDQPGRLQWNPSALRDIYLPDAGGTVALTSASTGIVALGTDTTGNYMTDVMAGTGVTITHTPGEGSSASIAIGQDVSSSAEVTFERVNIGGRKIAFEGDTANDYETTLDAVDPTADRTIYIPDASGTIALTSGSTGVVTLGTDTAGNYVADVVAGTNISITHTPGEASSASIAVVGNPTFSGTASAADFRSSTFLVQPNGYVGWLSPADAYGRIYWSPSTTRTIYLPDVSGSIVTTGDTGTVTSTMIANGTIDNDDISETAGIGLLKLQNAGTGGQLIVTDASGVPTYQTITGDISVNASGVAVIQANSVALGTDTTGDYVASLVAGTGVTLSNNSGESSSPTIAIGQNVATNASVQFYHIAMTGPVDSSNTVATKQYVDQVAAGIDWHQAVVLATTATLPNSPTYDNGSSGSGATLTAGANARLSIDGANATTGDRVLVKNQSNAVHNGVYDVTEQGSASVAWVLARSEDFDGDTGHEIYGGEAVFVTSGTVNIRQGFTVTSTGSGTAGAHEFGTDNVSFTQFTGTASFIAGDGLAQDGNTISVGTASSTRIVVTAHEVDLATVGQTNTTGTAGTSFVQSHTVDSYGRVTGTVTADVQDASTSAKGIARFSSSEFSVSSGSVSIVDAGVGLAKLQSGSAGQIIVANSSGVPTYRTISGDITISDSGVASIAANSVALGTDTTGNYVSGLYADSGIVITHTPGEGSTASIGLDSVIASSNSGASGTNFLSAITVDGYGRVTAYTASDVQDASTSAKGIASFNSDHFSVSSGSVSLPQSIATTASPTFASASITGQVTAASATVKIKYDTNKSTISLNANTSSSPELFKIVDQYSIGTMDHIGLILMGNDASPTEVRAGMLFRQSSSVAGVEIGPRLLIDSNSALETPGSLTELAAASVTLYVDRHTSGSAGVVLKDSMSSSVSMLEWRDSSGTVYGSIGGSSASYRFNASSASLQSASVGDFYIPQSSSAQTPHRIYDDAGTLKIYSLNGIDLSATYGVTANSLTVSGNLTVNGTTTTVNSTTITVDDPIITLGGDTVPSSDDNKDRGIEFRYHSGTAASVGFMGYDDSSQWFTFLVGATNTNEVFSGTAASVNVGQLYINGSQISASNLSNGTVGSGSVMLSANAFTGSGAPVLASGPTFSGNITISSGASVGFDSSASVTLPSKTFFPEEYLTVSSSVTLNATTHRYATLEMTATSGTSVITVPADASSDFPVGSVIQIIRVGAGEVQVTASAGVTVNNALGSRLRAQWSTATLRKRAANTWLLSGDLKV